MSAEIQLTPIQAERVAQIAYHTGSPVIVETTNLSEQTVAVRALGHYPVLVDQAGAVVAMLDSGLETIAWGPGMAPDPSFKREE